MKHRIFVPITMMSVVAASAVADVDIRTQCAGNEDPVNMVFTLTDNCITDETLLIPDGWTVDGNGYTITAVDPAGGHFRGAVVRNGGAVAHLQNLTVTAAGLANVCDRGDDRLRGIMFEAASGSILNNTVIGINQGFSGCQEGNAIEVRNAPFDGTHPNTQFVTINHNFVDDYQKTGIVANGDVEVTISNNFVGSADLPENIAANSVQLGFGASGTVNNNVIEGNQWNGASNYVATAVLIYWAGDVNVNHNSIFGEGTDVGILAQYSGRVNIMNNDVARTVQPGDPKDDYGVGVWFYNNAGKSKLVRNDFSGWNYNYFGADLDRANVSD
ncbi:MAG: right-handed parallel beta-helix repeat-containing protein [Phycisphaerales bacterium]